jgi:hypothetical protein
MRERAEVAQDKKNICRKWFSEGVLMCRLLVPPTLHENTEDIPILIDGAPQIIALMMDRQNPLVETPCVPGSRTLAPGLIGKILSEFPAPLADRFIGHDDTPGEQELFHITAAQAEAET